ncbi:DUF58 domain-containing protein [Vulcanisaeta thermophila]|uniref:DUF58 domain-containing protein n=1 Tax=Vulcanisaeta thermophila TaxID=867917 RepID=UPI000853E7E9|nr:DUF58 domain-containing protein [Vulcanisaeta thermophila]
MVKELLRATSLLVVLPLFSAVALVLTTHRELVLAVVFPMIMASIVMLTGTNPRITTDLTIDRGVMYIGEELRVRVRLRVIGGFGIIMVRGPPAPNTNEADAFELSSGRNVIVVFKGPGTLEREFEYGLRALVRGRYDLGRVEYTYYHAFGFSNPVRGTVTLKREVQVLPRVKIINRIVGIMKMRQGAPRYSPARLGPHSTEFRAIRDYVIGDPYRFINWKATARSPDYKLKVNEYEREGTRTILFILDAGWWMRYGTLEDNPLEYGISLILSLARAYLRYGFNVGLWVPQARIYVMPSSGSTQYYRVLSRLMSVRALAMPTSTQSRRLKNVQWGGYAVDPLLSQVVLREGPSVIYVTNITREGLGQVLGFLRTTRSRALIVDVIPSTIVLRGTVNTTGCLGNSLMFERRKLYSLFPGYVKIVPWDPLCEPMGLVITRIMSYTGRLL